MSKRLITMLAAVVALAAIAAGCGSSDDESLTKAEFIKQGNSICKKIEKETEAEYMKASAKASKEGKKQSKALGEELAAEVLIPRYRSKVEGLQELSPPSDDEDQVTAMLDAGQEGVEKAEEDPRSIFEPQDDPFTEVDKLTVKYGLEDCDLGQPG